MRHLSPSLTHGYGRAGPTKSTLSASDDAWRCQAPASCQSLDQQACATARSRSSRCMALSYLLLLVPKCVPWPTPVHTHRAAVGAARALLQVFRSLAAVCSPSIVAFDFGFSDRSFSAPRCARKNNPERKPPARVSCARERECTLIRSAVRQIQHATSHVAVRIKIHAGPATAASKYHTPLHRSPPHI